MTDRKIPQELRQRAEQMRRAARVPTVGGRMTDRLLLQLARQLDEEADRLEASG
jgi:hypothetical protein